MEEAGVHVSYGLRGYKIHSKLCMIVRQEEDRLRRYLHLATGNYNPSTAKLYTDLGMMTCRDDYGDDAAAVFNLLTGFCEFEGTKKLIVAPFEFQSHTLELIQRETEHAREGKPTSITAKMNSLVDKPVIEALYEASQAGMSQERLQKIIDTFSEDVRQQKIPGFTSMIFRKGKVVQFEAHGFADMENRVPLRKDSLFRIYSMFLRSFTN